VAHGVVAQDLVVREIFDLANLIGGERLARPEVEPQSVWGDQRALLLHVVADDLTQRPVEDVRARVIPPNRIPAGNVDRGGGLLPRGDVTFDDLNEVAMLAGEAVGRVEHLGTAGVGGDGAGVADLAARLGIER
jgi:hypothetical protein